METLTLSDAGYLSDVLRAVERNAKLRWYPLGTDSADYPLVQTMRAVTREGGGLWSDADGDVRDAYVWTSGMTETWLPVRELTAALRRMTNPDNADWSDKPLAVIET